VIRRLVVIFPLVLVGMGIAAVTANLGEAPTSTQ